MRAYLKLTVFSKKQKKIKLNIKTPQSSGSVVSAISSKKGIFTLTIGTSYTENTTVQRSRRVPVKGKHVI